MKVVAIIFVAAVLWGVARAAEWESYQIILDRHPFGALRDTTNATPEYAKKLRLSALWQVHGQPRAGFEDVSTKTNQSFVLACGEKSEDGLELVEVHYADEAVVVRKGTEITVLHMQAGTSTNAPLNIATTPGGPGAPSTNPWREFYERYRQRRHDERAGDPSIQPPIPNMGAAMQGAPPMSMMGGSVAPPMPTMISPEIEARLRLEGVIPESHKKHKTKK